MADDIPGSHGIVLEVEKYASDPSSSTSNMNMEEEVPCFTVPQIIQKVQHLLLLLL